MKKVETKKVGKIKPSDEELVEAHMAAIKHALKEEMETIRKIIKGVDSGIKERIKWNAPSYYYTEDMVTFGPVKDDQLLLVFHHPHIEKIKSPILQGDYKGRRLSYFGSMADIRSTKKELVRIISELIKAIKQKQK